MNRNRLSSRTWLIALPLAALTAACGQGVSADDARWETQPVLGGTPSGTSQNAVVAVIDNHNGAWGSGVLISRTLVLTARHLLFESAEGTSLYYECDVHTDTGAPLLRALDPTRFSAFVGSGYPFDVYDGVRTYSSADLDLCADDLAILELDRPVEASTQPLAIQLAGVSGARHVSLNDGGILVGWGSNEVDEDDAPSGRFQGIRKQLPLKVLAVDQPTLTVAGRTPIQVMDSSFLTDQGGCHGDSGGPFISDETGAVVGIFSSFEPTDPIGAPHLCTGSHSVFRKVRDQSAWIREAFARAGQAPWVEGHAKPAQPGEACKTSEDCASGLCESVDATQFCSLACDAVQCPGDMACVAVETGEHLCVPSRVVVTHESSTGCAMRAPRRRDTTKVIASVLGLLALVLLRRPWYRKKVPRTAVYPVKESSHEKQEIAPP